VNRRNRPLVGAESDAVNRRLLIAVLAMIIAVLGVVGWLVYSVVVLAAAPRTAVEREVMKLESLSRTQPNNGEVWADWATALIASGDLQKAADVISRGSTVASDTAPIKVAEARLLVRQSRPGDAVKILDTLVKSMLEQETSRAKALAAADTVVPRDVLTSPFLVDAQILRGDVLAGQGKVAEAIVAYSFALERNPQMSDVLAARGDLYARSGKPEDAERDYRKALTMLPDFAPAIDGLKRLGKAVTK
jgi:tetratricopeptide (TPR) repeat protein